ncbi:MAG TPA: response regulator transcription factor [Candidatus Deferrimicrobiaceae bacterium]
MIRVLIADDHAIFRQGLESLLSRNPAVTLVGAASNGPEVLSMVDSLRPQVVVLDISMPGMDGFEVVRRLREQASTVKVLLLSMHKDPVSLRLAVELQVDGYILKDEAVGELMTAIQAVSRGKRHFSPQAKAAIEESEGGRGGELLAPRELQVVALIAEGKTTKEIAAALNISVNTVATHRERIMQKLGFKKVAQIVSYALKTGIVK